MKLFRTCDHSEFSRDEMKRFVTAEDDGKFFLVTKLCRECVGAAVRMGFIQVNEADVDNLDIKDLDQGLNSDKGQT